MPYLDLYAIKDSIGAKVSSLNIAQSIDAGVAKFSEAAQGSLGSVPGLKILSKFIVKDMPKPPPQGGGGTSPEEAKQSGTAFAGALSFPSAMKYYTKFTFKEYDKKVVNQATKDQPTVVIILPRPNDMHESFGVTYAEPALGPVLGNATDSVVKALRGENIEGAKTMGENTVKGGEAATLNLLKKGGYEKTAALGSMGLGVAPNPNLAVLFENIGLREHSFSYKFAPTSRQELQTLKNIIQQLKTRMLPGMDTQMLFTFPDVCDIEFGPIADNPYTIKRCVMTSLNVNYTPMGSPAFFKTGDPVMVEIQMSFKETSPYTRVDVVTAKRTLTGGR